MMIELQLFPSSLGVDVQFLRYIGMKSVELPSDFVSCHLKVKYEVIHSLNIVYVLAQMNMYVNPPS